MGTATKALRFTDTLGAAIVLLIVVAAPGAAQSDRGAITGRVFDPQTAVIVDAMVIALDAETGTEYRTATTSTGDYTLSSLPARRYDVTIEAAGFKTFVLAGVRVQVAQATRVDATLEIGTATPPTPPYRVSSKPKFPLRPRSDSTSSFRSIRTSKAAFSGACRRT